MIKFISVIISTLIIMSVPTQLLGSPNAAMPAIISYLLSDSSISEPPAPPPAPEGEDDIDEEDDDDDDIGSYVFLYPPYSPFEILTETELAQATIEGYVKSAASGSTLSNVTVSINGNSTTTNSSGKYTFTGLSQGSYVVNFARDGYLGTTYTQVVDEAIIYNLDVVLFMPSTYTGTSALNGEILDAETGNKLDAATLKIRTGLNKKIGEVLKTITSTSSGYSVGLTKGYYTIEVSKIGYISAFYNIYASSDSITKDLIISKIMQDNEMRIVLSWGENPSDLDSHISQNEGNTVLQHIYYNHQTGTGVKLDTDDTTSYGPETVTLNNSSNYTYKYYVHDYTNKGSSSSSAMSSSGAKVTVYTSNNVKVYYPPLVAGTVWKVFEINNGYIQSCTTDCMFYESSPSSTSTFSRSLSKDTTSETSLFLNLPAK